MAPSIEDVVAALTDDERRYVIQVAQNFVRSRGDGNGTYCALLGMRFTIVEPGRARGEMPVSPLLYNPGQVAQGGALFSFADQLMGAALYSALPAGTLVSSLEIKINYVAAAREGTLVGEGRILKQGRRIVHMQSEVRDQSGELVALAIGTFYVLGDGGRG